MRENEVKLFGVVCNIYIYFLKYKQTRYYKDLHFRWADHSDTFLKTFSVMYNDEVYTDCTLVAENQFFKGHRMVLSSASELLDEMFKITPGRH